MWRAAGFPKGLRQMHSGFYNGSCFRDPGWSTMSTLDKVLKCVSFYPGLITSHCGDGMSLTKPPSSSGPFRDSCAWTKGHVTECAQGRWPQLPVLDQKSHPCSGTQHSTHKTKLFSCPVSADEHRKATFDSAPGRTCTWLGTPTSSFL